MGKYLIVGGGLGGLLVRNHLLKKEVSVEGLEKSDSLGSRIMAEDQRFYSGETARMLQTAFETQDVGFSHESDSPKEVKKGVFVELGAGSVPPPLSEYVQTPFFAFNSSFQKRVLGLVAEAADDFRLRKTVTKVKPSEKILVCSDGEEIAYEKLVWCAPLRALIKALGENIQTKVKLAEQESEGSGLVLEMQSNEEWFSFRNTLCLPFRYKDYKLTALGTSREKGLVRWMLFLEEGLVDDREEVAKCLRALKRELGKVFPLPMANLVRERVVFWPLITGEPVAALKSLELAEGVCYVGTQARLPHVDTDVKNLDLLMRNIEAFELLAEEWIGESDVISTAISEGSTNEVSV